MMTATLPSLVDVVLSQHAACYRVTMRNLEGISDEESRIPPQTGGNSIHWLLRHIIATRDRTLPSLGQQPVQPPESATLEELIAALGESQDRIATALKGVTEDRLSDKAPFSPRKDPNETLASFLPLLAFHEAYHSGQIGIVRRTLGKEGVIK